MKILNTNAGSPESAAQEVSVTILLQSYHPTLLLVCQIPLLCAGRV